VQVVYVIDGSTLTTYNVNPQTLQASAVGTITLPQSVYPGLVTSANGRFLYYSAYENTAQQGKRLYVYDTSASGVPGSTSVQTLSATGLDGIAVNPAGNYLYAVYQGTVGQEYTPHQIERYAVDSTTGKLSGGTVQATYELGSGYGGSEICNLSILGISAAGSEMYDEIGCSYHGGSSATYNERTLNAQTGALGPDVQVYSWNNSTEGFEFVQFVQDLVFDFVMPNNYDPGTNYVDIYQLQPNVSKPEVDYTITMLKACGNDGGIAHPSGNWIFFFNAQGATVVGEVKLSNHKITGPFSPIPYEVQQFSPDGTIAYAANDVNTALNVEIYGFNQSSGSLTKGGTISVPSDLDSWFTAQRD
jgi:hypothetical protein